MLTCIFVKTVYIFSRHLCNINANYECKSVSFYYEVIENIHTLVSETHGKQTQKYTIEKPNFPSALEGARICSNSNITIFKNYILLDLYIS